MPQTRSPYADLAIAHGSGDSGALAMVDAALDQTPAVAAPVKPRPVAKRTVVAQAEPALAAKSAPQPMAASAIATPVPVQPLALHVPPTSPSDEQRFAQREQQSQKQREFRGGDAIIISASTLVVVLLIVLLVLLLT